MADKYMRVLDISDAVGIYPHKVCELAGSAGVAIARRLDAEPAKWDALPGSLFDPAKPRNPVANLYRNSADLYLEAVGAKTLAQIHNWTLDGVPQCDESGAPVDEGEPIGIAGNLKELRTIHALVRTVRALAENAREIHAFATRVAPKGAKLPRLLDDQVNLGFGGASGSAMAELAASVMASGGAAKKGYAANSLKPVILQAMKLDGPASGQN